MRGGVALVISRVFPFPSEETVEAESAAPTCSPPGRELSRPRVPLLLPLVPLPDVFVPEPAADPGVPAAPALPDGFAANVPRRFPPGAATGPVGATGFSPSATSRPDDLLPLPPTPPPTVGGGPTGCTPAERPPVPCPATVCCLATISWGAGATTWLGPILSAPTRPTVDRVTSGAGSTTVASGPDRPLVRVDVSSGGGATIA